MGKNQDYIAMELDELEAREEHLRATLEGVRGELREVMRYIETRRQEEEVSKKLGREVKLVPVSDDPDEQARFAQAAMPKR